MDREGILPVLYDLAVTIGSETSLKPLLARTLQRLLYHTSFSAGFVCLDVPRRENEDPVDVKLDAAVGDFDLISLVGQRLALPAELLKSTPGWESDQAALLSALPGTQTRYQSFLRLPLNGNGVIVLLAATIPETNLPLTRMLAPVLSHLSKAIVLCQNNDAYTGNLTRQHNLLSKVFESSYSCVIITDASGAIMDVNPAFTRITGYSKAEAIGQNPNMLASGQHDHRFFSEMWAAVTNDGHWEGEIWNRRKSGEVYPSWLSLNQVKDQAGIIQFYVGTSSDISKRKAAEARIHQLAFYDELTKLPNRRLLIERLRQGFSTSVRNGKHGAVLFLDLDNFKALNDTKGHDVGDLFLIEVAKRLNACVRDGDTVARIGGDEFVIVLEALNTLGNEAARQASSVADKIRVTLCQPFQLDKHAYHTSPSIGVVLFRGHQTTVEDVLKYADTAMYQAKTSGRNAVRFYDPVMQAAIEARAVLEEDLRFAIERQQLRLHYQVQVDEAGQPVGAEVLLRWVRGEHGMVSPADFIELAESSGLILPIGLWVLQQACAQLKSWQQNDMTRELTLAVNVSAKQFRSEEFVDQVKRALAESGVLPHRLKLELTESAVLMNVEETIAKMRQLKQLGVEFSLDDFGTGYSSLQYLKRLPFNQIKIDQSFVRDITHDVNDAAIVQTIIAMSEIMGLTVIAEGVETESQLEFLKKRGCHTYQGYLFGRPMDAESFVHQLRAL